MSCNLKIRHNIYYPIPAYIVFLLFAELVTAHPSKTVAGYDVRRECSGTTADRRIYQKCYDPATTENHKDGENHLLCDQKWHVLGRTIVLQDWCTLIIQYGGLTIITLNPNVGEKIDGISSIYHSITRPGL